ncbi:hypothetical protein TNCV_168271 [Trichonephila clavipes]|nr:hypothetical protein TNCV_168271 [Trichonephila clavipes]
MPTALWFVSTRIENVQWCMTVQHYATTHKDSFATKSVNFCYFGEMKASSISSSGEDLTRITFFGTFRHINEKSKPPSCGDHD